MKSRRKALTLIELVAALAIVGMLMTAAFAAIGGLSRAEAREQTQADKSAAITPLLDLLRSDLFHASSLEKIDSGYTLQTCAYIDERNQEFRHLPCQVRYSIRQIGSRRWLIRTQRPQTLDEESSQLACCGVASLELSDQDGQSITAMPDASQLPSGEVDSAGMPVIVATVRFSSADMAPLRIVARRD